MTNLFPIYRGRKMEIGPETHAFLQEHYPEVDLHSEYRSMDAWLFAHPRRLPTKRFLVNWLNRRKRFEITLADKQQEKQDAIRRETQVGAQREGR